MKDVYLTNYNVAAARLIAAVLLIPLLSLITISIYMDLGSQNVKGLLLAVLGPLGIAGFALMAIMVTFSITIGDALVAKTLFGKKRYPLSDIEQIRFDLESTTIKHIPTGIKHRMMYITLKSRKFGFVLKVSQAEAEQVIEAMDARGLSEVFAES